MSTPTRIPDPAAVLRHYVEEAKRAGRFQKDIARAAGMSEPQLTRLLQGERTLRRDVAGDLDEALNLADGPIRAESEAAHRFATLTRVSQSGVAQLTKNLFYFPIFSRPLSVASA